MTPRPLRAAVAVLLAAVVGVGAGATARAQAKPPKAPAKKPAPASRPTSRPSLEKSKPPVDTGTARDRAIFGGGDDSAGKPSPGPTSKPSSADKSPAGGSARDRAIFGGGGDSSPSGGGGKSSSASSEPRRSLADRLRDKIKDKLQIGGLLYMRFTLNLTNGDDIKDHQLSMPNLTDVYLDVRPNDRVRAFVRGRLLYTPTLDESSPLASGQSKLQAQLNEMWLKFDIARRLYVTIGSHRVLWGTTRLWNPVDFINQTLRPILQPFDARNGIPMVKLHLPIESLGWNFYVVGLLDGVDSLDKGGVVGRAEFVFSTIELALSGSYRKGLDPRVGLDFSAGFWDFDLLGEASLTFDDRFDHDVGLRVSLGLQYSAKVFNDDMFVTGFEFFYNQLGSGTFRIADIISGDSQFFYVGRHYLAAFASLPSPGTLDNWTFTLSGIGNLSDESFIGRLDVSVVFLTYITVQLFAAVHFGQQGELRLGDRAFDATLRAGYNAAYGFDANRRIPTQAVDLGLWLRVNL